MPYLFKQKLNIGDLIALNTEAKRVLIFEPEEYLSGIYAYHLSNQDFEVVERRDLYETASALSLYKPHLLVFNAEFLGGTKKNKTWLLSVKKDYPQLHVVTTGYNLSSEGVGELMAAGISSHLNRRLTRPQDLAVIVKSILYS